MPPVKIVVIGAGSASFGLNTLAHLVACEKLHGGELALVDTNAEALPLMRKLAERMSAEWGAAMRISATTQRRRALPDADFVILAVAQDRENRWKRDYEIPLKYGHVHFAETGGPGGVGHTLRSVNLVLPILRDAESLCPNAWVLNFTNPVPRITLAATRYTSMKFVGVCHQINWAYMMVGAALAGDLGIPTPKRFFPSLKGPFSKRTHEIMHEAHGAIDIKAAGTNHNTWILDIRDKRTGKDLYPLFTKRLNACPPAWEPLTRRLHKMLGICPATGDSHIGEYIPWIHDLASGAYKRLDLRIKEFSDAKRGRNTQWRRIRRMVAGSEPVDPLRDLASERASEIITGIAFDENSYELAVDVPNEGQIANLPDGAIVETPAVVSAFGIRAVGVGELPAPVAEICRRETTCASLAVDAAVKRSRALAVQAVLYSPGLQDIDMAEKITDDLLRTHEKFLPKFK